MANYFKFIIFILLILSGCEDSAEQKSEKEYSFYYGSLAIKKNSFDEVAIRSIIPNLNNTTIGIQIRQLTGVKLQYLFPQTDKYEEEAFYMTSTGDFYPDIIYAYSTIHTFVKAGALIPLNDLIDKYGYNIKKYYGSLLNLFKNDDGIIYFLGNNFQLDESFYPGSGLWLRADLLKDADWPVVKRFDQYMELISNYLRKYSASVGAGSVTGFTLSADIGRSDMLIRLPALLMGYPTNGTLYIDAPDSNDLKLILTADFAKGFYNDMNRFWNDRVLDREIFSRSYEDHINQIAAGEILGFYGNIKSLETPLKRLDRRVDHKFTYVPFPVVFDEMIKDNYLLTKHIPTDSGVGISVNCNDPVGVIKYWNRLLDDDIQKLIYWGEKQGHYYVSSSGKFSKTESQTRRYFSSASGLMKFIDGFPQRDQSSFYSDGNPISPFSLKSNLEFITPSYIKDIWKHYNINSFKDLFSPPGLLPTGISNLPHFETDPAASKMKLRIDEIAREYLVQLISSDPKDFEGIWDSFQKALTTSEIERYLTYLSIKYKRLCEIYK